MELKTDLCSENLRTKLEALKKLNGHISENFLDNELLLELKSIFLECPIFKCSIEDLEKDARNTPSLPFQIMNQLKSLQIIAVKAMVGLNNLSPMNKKNQEDLQTVDKFVKKITSNCSNSCLKDKLEQNGFTHPNRPIDDFSFSYGKLTLRCLDYLYEKDKNFYFSCNNTIYSFIQVSQCLVENLIKILKLDQSNDVLSYSIDSLPPLTFLFNEFAFEELYCSAANIFPKTFSEMLGKNERDARQAATFVILYQVLPNLQKTDICIFNDLNRNLQKASFAEIYDNNKRDAIERDKNLRDSKNIIELHKKLEEYCGQVIQSRRVKIMQKHHGTGFWKLPSGKETTDHWILSKNGHYLITVINRKKISARIYLKDISQVHNFKSEGFTIRINSSEPKYSCNELNVYFRNDQICKAWFYGLESIIRGETIIIDDEGREELHQLILNEIQVRLMTLDLYSLEASECTANVTSPPPDPLFE